MNRITSWNLSSPGSITTSKDNLYQFFSKRDGEINGSSWTCFTYSSITTEWIKTWNVLARVSGTKIFYKGCDKLALESSFGLHMGGRWGVTSKLSWQFRVLGLQAAFFCISFQPSVPILYFHTRAAAQLDSALPLLSAFLPFIPAQVPHSHLFLLPLMSASCNIHLRIPVLQDIIHGACRFWAESSGTGLQTVSERNPRQLTMQKIVNLVSV